MTQAALSAFAALVALVVALGWAVARAGAGIAWFDVAGALGLAWTLLLLPGAVARRTGGDPGRPWWQTRAAVALGALAAVALLGWVAGSRFTAVAVVGVGVWLLIDAARQFGRLQWLPISVTAIAIALFVVGHAWGSGYQSPLLLEKLATGRGHVDPLYHLALAQMIDVHGVPSTGLDGTPYTPYHFGSHALFVGLARLLHQDLPTFYALTFPVAVVPWLLQQWLGFALDVRTEPEKPLPWTFWLVAATAFAGVFLPDFSRHAWVGANLCISESHGVATALSFAAGSLAVHVWRQHEAGHVPSVGTALFVALPLLVGWIGVTKVSHAALLLGLTGVALVRVSLWRKPMFLLVLLLAGSVGLTFVLTTTPAGISQGVRVLAFVRENVLRERFDVAAIVALVAFVALHYLWPWLYLGLQAAGAIPRRPLERTLLVAFVVLATLPGLLLPIQGGGAYYFSDTQRWLGSALVLAAWPEVDVWLRLRLAASVRAVLVLALLASFAYLTGRGLHRLSTDLASTRNATARPGGAVVRALVELGRKPREERRYLALFVPRERTDYWQLVDPKAAPFLGPALGGVALVGGLPDGDFRLQSYGYLAYGEPGGRRVHNLEAARKRVHNLRVLELPPR